MTRLHLKIPEKFVRIPLVRMVKFKFLVQVDHLAQSVGVVEYTDCTSAEG